MQGIRLGLAIAFILVDALALRTSIFAQGKAAQKAARPVTANADALSREVERLSNAGRFAEAIPLAQRALALRENALGPNHPDVGSSAGDLGELFDALGRYEEAEPLYQRALAIQKKALGEKHAEVAHSLKRLAVLYEALGRLTEAEKFYKGALEIVEVLMGPRHSEAGLLLNVLGLLYQGQGRLSEAEPPIKRSLAIREEILGLGHPDVGQSLNSLGLVYQAQGRLVEAEQLYKRALAIIEQSLGPDHYFASFPLNNLAAIYASLERYREAEQLYKRALDISETAHGPEHALVGTALSNLAALYQTQGRLLEAEPLLKRAIAVREKTLGSAHPQVSHSLNNLALLYRDQGRLTEAGPLMLRALAISESALGEGHLDVGTALNNLAWYALAQNDIAGAADYWRRATVILQRRAERGLSTMSETSYGAEVQQYKWYFHGLAKTTYQLAATQSAKVSNVAVSMFEAAQWSLASEAADSLVQMGARSVAGSIGLASLIRERQDLVGEWHGKDKQLIAAKSQSPAQRNAQIEKSLNDRLAAIDTRLRAIDTIIGEKFPGYAKFVSSRPSSAASVQEILRDDEALVLTLDTDDRFKLLPEETFVWVVTKTEVRWVRSEFGTKALTEMVQALRCGLDEEEWSTPTRAGQCGKRLGISEIPAATAPLPFDLGKAHQLYKSLFGKIEDLIRDKRLLIVPSGPLTSLPFQVLNTEAPVEARPGAFEGYRNVAWLGTKHAISVLPAVSSLKALRTNIAGRARADLAYVGYGNPNLHGDAVGCRSIKVSDQCPGAGLVVADGGERAKPRGRGSRRNSGLSALNSRTGNVDETIARVRALCPLPDTAYEISCIAKGFAETTTLVRLDQNATEANLKALSKDGALYRYRVVHFATHGLLASDVAQMRPGRPEPALVLTPPDGSPQDSYDDGLLTASEIADLKLNAEWVVLSACNTAASDGSGAEALSGLARAFIYAGARALLVSHWPVYSDAAVRLTTAAFVKLDREPTLGRAEAMRRATVDLIADTSQNDNVHPAVWAPFVVVGEGGSELLPVP